MASSNSSAHEDNQVLFEQHSSGLKVILNRPQKLNSLTHEMLCLILKRLKVYENDPTIKVIILKGNGRGFSAGGDIIRLINYATLGHWTFAVSSYKKLLTVDYFLATCKKPLVSIINGIVMGGGAGLSMHGTFRIVTEKAVFAMPEASVGFFPDVGASHFLSRLPGFFGEYLGLTGAHIEGSEMLACGLATHFVFSKDIHLLENELCEVISSNTTTISHIINRFIHKAYVKQDSAYKRLEIINKCFSRNTVEEILSSLENEVANQENHRWLVEAISSMKKASPLSLKIFLRLIREGRTQNLEQCLMRDYIVGAHMLRGTVNNDFYEGTRALLFDKDKNPKWEPSKLELVTEEMVDKHLTEMDDDECESLRLPVRSNTAKPRL